MARLLMLAALLWLNACATASWVTYQVAPDYPEDESGTLHLPGLHAPVTVYLDQAGVAHLDASDEADLLRAAGFFQARSRFFAMDMMRRFARGRLAELVGDQPVMNGTTLEFDRAMRGWGFEQAAERDVAGLDPGQRELLTAFVEGINAGLERFDALEYRLLREDPRPWTLLDCFALGRLNAWSVTHNWRQELSRLLLALHGGVERAGRIYPPEPWHGRTSLPDAVEAHDLPPAVAPEAAALFPPRPWQPDPAQGAPRQAAASDPAWLAGASNAWVVAGDRSASGQPLLANDPHLAHLLPSLMYQQHLRAPGLDVIGAGLAGLPYVLAGHNQRVAWGVTSAVLDTVDLYLERPDPADPTRVETPCGEGQGPGPCWAALVCEEHLVRVGGDDPGERRVVIRRSPRGPLVNDLYPGLLPEWAPPVALRWETGPASSSVAALGRANHAGSVDELRQALLGMSTPAAAWTAADVEGTIAVFATGSVPQRLATRGTFPTPGWLPQYAWAGAVPAAELPVGTARAGVMAHANNLMRDPAHDALFLQVDSAPSYRLERILGQLEATPRHTPDSFAALQRDVYLERGRRLTPVLLGALQGLVDPTPLEVEALSMLRAWDFEANVDSVATTVFFATYREATVAALRDELDADGFAFFLADRYSTNVADQWLEDAACPVWDDRSTPAPEGRDQALRAAFQRAVAGLVASLGGRPSDWRWGRVHDLEIHHPFGGREALAASVNLPRAEVAGGLDSVWKSHFDLADQAHPFRAVAGPVYRMIVDLGDLAHGRWVLDTGTSGWPGSPHYADQHQRWKAGQYFPMLYDWAEVRAQARAIIRLE
jgi:penicillin amidase